MVLSAAWWLNKPSLSHDSVFFQGWCNNVYGPTAFVVAYQKGFMKAVMADLDIICDLIPLDYVVNGVLAAAMKTGTDFMDGRKERKSSTGSESDSDFFTDGGEDQF